MCFIVKNKAIEFTEKHTVIDGREEKLQLVPIPLLNYADTKEIEKDENYWPILLQMTEKAGESYGPFIRKKNGIDDAFVNKANSRECDLKDLNDPDNKKYRNPDWQKKEGKLRTVV